MNFRDLTNTYGFLRCMQCEVSLGILHVTLGIFTFLTCGEALIIMQVSNKTVKRVTQILVLIILGTGALMVIFIVGRLYVQPTDYLPPTIDPLVPSMDLSVTVTESSHTLIAGTTDLPEGTLLMIHLKQENGNYSGQEQVTVGGGSFQSGIFGPEGGLDYGFYHVQVLTLPSSQQPPEISKRFGPNGVNLVGDLIIQEEGDGKVRAEARYEIVRPPPVMRGLSGSGIGQKLIDYANGFEISLLGAYKAINAFGIAPPATANRDYNNEFLFVEISYTNLQEQQRFISYVDFVLFLDEEFALSDINIPFTIYPDGRFTVMNEGKDFGFFSTQEVLSGESFTGMIAFLVPDKARNFVFSSNATSCIEQDGNLQCYGEFPKFDFND